MGGGGGGAAGQGYSSVQLLASGVEGNHNARGVDQCGCSWKCGYRKTINAEFTDVSARGVVECGCSCVDVVWNDGSTWNQNAAVPGSTVSFLLASGSYRDLMGRPGSTDLYLEIYVPLGVETTAQPSVPTGDGGRAIATASEAAVSESLTFDSEEAGWQRDACPYVSCMSFDMSPV